MKLHRKAVALAVAVAASLTGCSTGGTASNAGDSAADYPDTGKSITLLIPYGAGGGSDLAGRLAASGLEKELGVTIVVENNPAGSGQQAITQLAGADPDGYTLAFQPLPALNTMYLDAERGASFTRDDFVPIANHDTDPVAFGVAANSPFKSMKDVIDAATTNPGSVTSGSNGVLAAAHLGLLQLQESTGAKFTWTSFDDGGQLRTSVLGGSVDLEVQPVSELTAAAADGSMRILGIMTDERLKGLPDVPTLAEIGYPDALMATNRILLAPAGTPQEIVDKLSSSLKTAMEDPAYQAQAQERLLELNYMDAAAVEAMWENFDNSIGTLIKAFRSQG